MTLPRAMRVATVALVVTAAVAVWPVAKARSEGLAPVVVGQRPWLGLAMASESSGRGVKVTHVVRHSPAAEAGVLDGDSVVLVGSISVARAADVQRAISEHGVGDSVWLLIRHGGAERRVRAVLTPLPSSDERMRMDLVGAPAPSWKGIVAVGGDFPQSITALRGRVVLLDFWATWCGPCRFVMPRLDALQDRLGAQGVRVFGVSTEEPEEVGQFVRQSHVRYPMGVDTAEETTRAYGVSGLPTLIVIDKRGVVREAFVGYDAGEYQRLEAIVASLVAEPDPI